jgi:heptosyltransferase II
MTEQPQRILVRAVNWLGDLVISLPALRAIRFNFPGAELSVLVKRELAGFFDGMDWIGEVLPYHVRSGPGGWRDQLEVVKRIRERRFDLAVLFPNSFGSALWIALAGVPRRLGYAADARSFLLTERRPLTHSLKHGHQSAEWLALAQSISASAAPPLERAALNPPLEVAEANLGRMRLWLERIRNRPAAPLIAIAPAAAYGPAKEWPSAHYADLINLLNERHGAECALIGGRDDRSKCETIAAMGRTSAIVAAGETSIGELIALLSLCSGFAGNDSGPMHLSAAVGIPTAGIFGSTNPARTGPRGARVMVIHHRLLCSPCLARTCRYGHYDCLRGIQPAEVAEALATLGAFPTA